MGKADKAAEHAVAIEPVGEMGVPRTPDNVQLVPVRSCFRIERRPQPLAIKFGVRGRRGFAEELPEIRIFGESAKSREFELEQRKVRLVQVDRVNLGRLRREI